MTSKSHRSERAAERRQGAYGGIKFSSLEALVMSFEGCCSFSFTAPLRVAKAAICVARERNADFCHIGRCDETLPLACCRAAHFDEFAVPSICAEYPVGGVDRAPGLMGTGIGIDGRLP
jgi:hypothetical protein